MTTHIHLCGILAAMLIGPFAGVAVAQGSPDGEDPKSAKKPAALIATIPSQEQDDHQMKPKHKDARALYEIWQQHARLSGDIPGALIGELAAAVKVFITYNPTWETVPKLNEILPRLDATRDWKPADAIALLDEVAAVQDSPLQTAAEKMTAATIRQGGALPEKFAKVIWGETQPNGLRTAWVLEPSAAEHRIGTALKARLLVQNAGKLPVMARVPTWHQGGVNGVTARDATGVEVRVSAIHWTTRAMLVPVRLMPGEFIEINAPGVGLGEDAGNGPWAGPRVGFKVLAKPGDEITLTHSPIPLDGSGVGRSEDTPHLIGAGWWLAHIKARLSRELPLPASGAKRTHLLDRAVRELFATTPTADEIATFATDQTDGAFDALVQRLAARTDVVEFAGSLPTAPVKFRVLPADPAADKNPRVVLGPGEYPLSETATIKIVGRPDGVRNINDTEIISKPSVEIGIPVPEKIEVPDGWGTWAIVCRPGEGFFYLLHKGDVRKIDYTNPRQITDTPATNLPPEFRDEVKRQLDIHEISAESQAEVFEKPAPPATTPEPKSAEAGPRADVKPVSKMLFNEDYAAFAVQSEKDVNFVLFYQGDLSSGISEWSSGAKWRFNGTVYLVDRAKTAVAGKNVNKRAISVQYTSDEPKKLYLDGKAYDLASPMHAAGAQAPQKPGRVFILRDEGEPIQTNRTLALRDEKDLVTIGNYAVHASVIADDEIAPKAPSTATAPGRYVLGDGVLLRVRQFTESNKQTNKATITFLSSDPKRESPHKPYPIGFYVPDSAYAFVWERGVNTLWVTEISEGAGTPIWMGEGGDLPGPQKVTVRAFDFSNPADVKLTHVSCSENSGDWSWGKIVPAAFHQPVLDALGERGKRLRDFIEPQQKKPAGASVPKQPKLPDEAYGKPGVHCQKFREEDAKRPGGERMGAVLEPSKTGESDKEPLVLGVRTASDARWRIGGTAKAGLVVRNRSRSDVKFSYTGRLDDGISVVAVDQAGKEHVAVIAQFDGLLAYQQMLLPLAHMATLKEFTLRFDTEKRDVSEPHVAAFHLPPGKYTLRCKWNDARRDVAHEGEWTGELVNEELEFTLAAAAMPADEKPNDEAAPGAGVPEKPPQSVAVDVAKDGSLSWNRKAVTMAELKAEAAREPKRRVVIRADKDVPYAKVIEVVETLKAAGVTEMSFREAHVGDGRYRVANVTGSYDFDGKHRFSICQPLGREQWFTVSWPAKDGQPLRLLRLYPNACTGKHGHWAVVWEPGTEVLWWVDESDVGKMSVADPAAVVVERESRGGAFSREFALPDGVAAEFRRLGHEVGGGSGEAKRTREVLKAEPLGKTKTAE